MFGFFAHETDSTHSLTRGACTITQGSRRSWRWLVLALLLATVAAIAAFRPRHWAPDASTQAELGVLSAQNKQLSDELVQLKMSARHDTATREELQRQLEERTAQLKKIQDELGFLRKQRGMSASSPVPAQ